MPKVSIIVPVYNVEKYLSKCLDSLLSQTLKDIEIICINDGSTDNSLGILKKFAKKDSRIKIIDKQNEGVSVARNSGIAVSTGTYLMFLDADDWFEVDACQIAYDKIMNSKSDIGIFCYREFENNRFKDSWHNTRIKKNASNNTNNNCFYFISIWHKIYKRDFLIQYNINFIKGLITSEDVCFSYLCYLHNPQIIYIDKNLMCYRKNREGSATTSNPNGIKLDLIALKAFNELDIVKTIDDKARKEIIDKWCRGCFYYIDKFADDKIYHMQIGQIKELICYLEKFYSKNVLEKTSNYKNLKYLCKKYDLERLFSVVNSRDRQHKVVSVLGLKFKFKRRK